MVVLQALQPRADHLPGRGCAQGADDVRPSIGEGRVAACGIGPTAAGVFRGSASLTGPASLAGRPFADGKRQAVDRAVFHCGQQLAKGGRRGTRLLAIGIRLGGGFTRVRAIRLTWRRRLLPALGLAADKADAKAETSAVTASSASTSARPASAARMRATVARCNSERSEAWPPAMAMAESCSMTLLSMATLRQERFGSGGAGMIAPATVCQAMPSRLTCRPKRSDSTEGGASSGSIASSSAMTTKEAGVAALPTWFPGRRLWDERVSMTSAMMAAAEAPAARPWG